MSTNTLYTFHNETIFFFKKKVEKEQKAIIIIKKTIKKILHMEYKTSFLCESTSDRLTMINDMQIKLPNCVFMSMLFLPQKIFGGFSQ